MIETLYFRNKKINIDKLLAYGFTKEENCYVYSTYILDSQFTLSVKITDESDVDTKLVDNTSGDEYTLHRVASAVGTFTGSVREAYDAVMHEIADECFDENIFKQEQTKELIAYVKRQYNRDLEYLWAKFPNNAVCRREDNEKWFAAVLTVSKRKIGLDSDEICEVIDLRLQPEALAKLVDWKKYFPGYHMNKKNWYTIILDGSVKFDEIKERIEVSYQIAKGK